MGTPDFAAVCLNALITSRHSIAAVLTQPDRPKGRGKKSAQPPVKTAALLHDIPILQPEKIKDAAAVLAEISADIFVVAAYGQFLPQSLLNMPKHGAINVHASLLPKYRGASPIQQAIANGDATTGITIMQMDKGMDTGDMLLTRCVAIDKTDTGGSLHDKLCAIAPEALLAALDGIESGRISPMPQNNAEATYAPLITKDMARVNWNMPPDKIVNHIRAYNPLPAAQSRLFGHDVKIWLAEEASGPKGNPGDILVACPKDGVIVAATGGAVRIKELTPTGGKKMSAPDFVRGYFRR